MRTPWDASSGSAGETSPKPRSPNESASTARPGPAGSAATVSPASPPPAGSPMPSTPTCASSSSTDADVDMPRPRNPVPDYAVTQALHDELLTTAELAELEKVTDTSVRRWRYEGTGPAYIKHGNRIRYRLSDVLAWRSANEVAA